MSNNNAARKRTRDIEEQGQRVRIRVSDSIQNKILISSQESITKDGSAVLVSLETAIRHDETVEFLIQPVEDDFTLRSVYLDKTPPKNHITDNSQHINITALKEGGIYAMEPFTVLSKDTRQLLLGAGPVKVGAGLTLGTLFGSYNALVWFFCICLADALLVMFPRVHPKADKRSSTLWARALQMGGSYIVLGMALAVQQFFALAHVNRAEELVAHLLPGFFIWTVIISYLLRIYGSFMKLMYGDKAQSAAKKMVKWAPKKIQNYFSDRDLWG